MKKTHTESKIMFSDLRKILAANGHNVSVQYLASQARDGKIVGVERLGPVGDKSGRWMLSLNGAKAYARSFKPRGQGQRGKDTGKRKPRDHA